ncbi:MAG: PDZ domain-containing protein [Planctomycetaceae bacterium]|jgi:serine protease Do
MNSLSRGLLALNLVVLGMLLGRLGWPLPGSSPLEAQEPASRLDASRRELAQPDSPLLRSSDLISRIVRLTTASVVHIETERRTIRGRRADETGSGVIIPSPRSGEFVVVTNSHVVDGSDVNDIAVHLFDKRVLRPVRKLEDRSTDLAVLILAERDLVAARLGDSDRLQIGHLVLAMGSPFGLSQSTTLGIISAKGRRALKISETSDMLNQDFLQTDAAINPGNSGGPLIDMQGAVIGINSAIASNSGGNEGIGFSIPSNLVRTVVDQLLMNGRVSRAYLGVSLDPDFNTEAATALKLDRVQGARVLKVNDNTPASRANLQVDDVVLTFDGVEVQDESHLINLVSLTPVGRKVKVVVFRNGKHISIDVTVDDRSQLDRSQGPAPAEPGTPLDQLGMTIHDLTSDVVAQLGFEPQTRGVLVLNVAPQHPLAQQLRPYDVLAEVAGRPVTSVAEVQQVLQSASDSQELVLGLLRRERGQVRQVALVHRKG